MNPKRILEIVIALCAILATCLVQCVAQDAKHIALERDAYQASFRSDLGIPEWVKWCVSRDYFGKTKRLPGDHFRTDPMTPKPRVKSSMYANTGYQRGHMCPAADMTASRALMKQTFYMSNICPMTPAVNTGAWKITETLERKLASGTNTIRVTACPLFFPQDTAWIGNGRVAVPHAFFKVITIDGDPFFFKIFIIENKWHYPEE